VSGRFSIADLSDSTTPGAYNHYIDRRASCIAQIGVVEREEAALKTLIEQRVAVDSQGSIGTNRPASGVCSVRSRDGVELELMVRCDVSNAPSLVHKDTVLEGDGEDVVGLPFVILRPHKLTICSSPEIRPRELTLNFGWSVALTTWILKEPDREVVQPTAAGVSIGDAAG